MEHKLFGWAKDKKGQAVCVSDVQRGLACECFCPACNSPLMAKKGQKRIAHFAHIKGADCDHGYEEAVHLLAKEVFRETKMLCPPQFVIRYECDYNRATGQMAEKIHIDNSKRKRTDDYEIQDEEIMTLMRDLNLTNKTAGRKSHSFSITFDEVLIEQSRGNIIPDAIGKKQGNELFVEFWNTHAVNDEKFDKIRESRIACVEVDLSDFKLKNSREADFKAMKSYLTSTSHIRWIYYPQAIENIKKELREDLTKIQEKEAKQQKDHAASHNGNGHTTNRAEPREVAPSSGENRVQVPSLSQREYELDMEFTGNIDYILDKVNDSSDNDVCPYVQWLRTLNGNPWSWQVLYESDRSECKSCIYSKKKSGKVFCQRY